MKVNLESLTQIFLDFFEISRIEDLMDPLS